MKQVCCNIFYQRAVIFICLLWQHTNRLINKKDILIFIHNIKRSVYFFNPRSIVDRPVPPPMAAIFGPAAQREDALLSYIIGNFPFKRIFFYGKGSIAGFQAKWKWSSDTSFFIFCAQNDNVIQNSYSSVDFYWFDVFTALLLLSPHCGRIRQ